MTILLSQYKFNTIFFFGNDPDKPEPTYLQITKNKSLNTIKKSALSPSNTNNISVSDGKNKKIKPGFLYKFSVKSHFFTEKPILSKPEMIENLLSGISNNLENFQNLSQIKFQYLQFSEIALENLSRVIIFF